MREPCLKSQVLEFNLTRDAEVRNAAKSLKQLASSTGFNDYECDLISLAFSELGMNAIRHGLGGSATIRRTDNNKGIEATIEDNGPGIPDFETALRDGFTTYGSLGLGLGAARRSVEELFIDRSDENGTSITMRHYLPVSGQDLTCTALSFPANGEVVNGDAYVIKHFQGEYLLAAVIDGAGRGEQAALVSRIAAKLIEREHKKPLTEIIQLAHKDILEASTPRAADIALLRVTPDLIEFAAIGDVRASSLGITKLSFPIQNGSAGLIIPTRIHVTEHLRPDHFCIALYSDGVSHIRHSEQIDTNQTARAIATSIFNSGAKVHDDATVLVIKS